MVNRKSIIKIVLTALLLLSCAGTKNIKKLMPEIISKEQWGGKKHFGEMPEHTISKITIHHGGVEVKPDKDPVQYMQNLQRFSMEEKKWMDIPYHYSIDLQGKIYACRPIQYPGDTNTEYDPTGHVLINVIGNYEIQKISEVQLQAIVKLTAWLAAKYSVPVRDIAGHKDYSKMTVCPGKDLYKYLQGGTIQQRVQEVLNELN
jgi:N-acetylmuramoyl-L-alanine amidase